jgi:single-strand DNA-binding protein
MSASKHIHRNVAVLVGAIAREPEVRELTDGTTVVELDVKVTIEGAPSMTVPVSWPGAVTPFAPGTEVVVVGRVRRRFYRAGGGTVSRTDVLADSVVVASSAKKVAAALAAAAARLDP